MLTAPWGMTDGPGTHRMSAETHGDGGRRRRAVTAEDVTPRLFESNFLEFFSKVHVSVPVMMFVPLIGYFFYRSLTDPLVTPVLSVAAFAAGIAQWTLTEYAVHRFVFHHKAKSAWGKRLFYIMHEVHHDYPNDRLRLVLPPAVSIPATIVIYSLASALYPSHILYPMAIGFAGSYLVYDLSHYAFHHLTFKNRIWQALRSHHLQHHFRDSATRYGVTSSLWDRLFGTH
jgi:sterol desaturase/sphingolipid hydroxylase (fatty acid hydroxylase superfamily)